MSLTKITSPSNFYGIHQFFSIICTNCCKPHIIFYQQLSCCSVYICLTYLFNCPYLIFNVKVNIHCSTFANVPKVFCHIINR